MLNRSVIMKLLITSMIAACAAGILFVTSPISAAPAAQTTLPDFTLDAHTVISVTVAISGGQVIVVPVDLNFIAQNHNDETDVSLIAHVKQQAGIFIGVAPSKSISATIALPQSIAAASQTAAAPSATNGSGTHIVNRNSNLRAGPGTSFQIVGRKRAGDTVTVVGQNNDGSWLQLDDGNWIAAFLVRPLENNTGEEETQAGGTPTPTATLTETVSTEPTDVAGQAELAGYVQELTAIGSQTNSAVDRLTGLLGSPEPQNPTWRSDVDSELTILSDALDQYLALTPVPGYADLHAQVTDVALTCEQAVDYLRSGINDPRSIDPALAEQSVQDCASKADDLAADLQALQ
jgi:hypothetical protein